MYCYHCGYEINERAIEQKKSTRKKYIDEAPLSAEIKYVCPRCGHLIHEGMDAKDTKSLSVACHAELQRGRNDFARGMCNLSIAAILVIIAIIFLQLSKKADIQYRISTACPEFWIFIVLSVISVILIGFGGFYATRGLLRKHKYTGLLKDINTKTLVQ